MSGKWRVRRFAKGKHTTIWEVLDADGKWSGDFDSWSDAMSWATNPFERLDYWRSQQPKPWMGDSFWGAPSDRDDQGRPL